MKYKNKLLNPSKKLHSQILSTVHSTTIQSSQDFNHLQSIAKSNPHSTGKQHFEKYQTLQYFCASPNINIRQEDNAYVQRFCSASHFLSTVYNIGFIHTAHS